MRLVPIVFLKIFIVLSVLNCSSEVKETKKEESLIDCTKSETPSKNYGTLVIKVKSNDETFNLQNVSVNFSESIPSINKEPFLHSLAPIPFFYNVDEITIPKVSFGQLCSPILNLTKDSEYEIRLPSGEYYASFSNEHENYFKFEPNEDKTILFKFGYYFDKEKKKIIELQKPCENKLERYDWDYNNGRGWVVNFNACPRIKIQGQTKRLITIIPHEKTSSGFFANFVKFIPGIVILDPFHNGSGYYYKERKYEIFLE